MKAQVGQKIKIVKEVCYGTVHGLVKIAEGTEPLFTKKDTP